jgi:hypothetical protein
MKVINSERQENSLKPFKNLMFFDGFSVDIKPDYDFIKNFDQPHSIDGKSTGSRSLEAISTNQLLKVQQDVIHKLESKIMRLQDEKLALVKWVEYLF